MVRKAKAADGLLETCWEVLRQSARWRGVSCPKKRVASDEWQVERLTGDVEGASGYSGRRLMSTDAPQAPAISASPN
jgi:hypothetical protein